MRPKEMFKLLKAAFWRWYGDNTFRLGAALAYYTVFSIAPVIVMAIGVAGLVFGKEAARAQLAHEVNQTVGPRVGHAIEETMGYIEETGSGVIATIIGGVLLLIGASSVFGQLQDALNTIWGV